MITEEVSSCGDAHAGECQRRDEQLQWVRQRAAVDLLEDQGLGADPGRAGEGTVIFVAEALGQWRVGPRSPIRQERISRVVMCSVPSPSV